MKNLIDDRGRMTPARNKPLRIGLILWPQFSLLALSGLMEALRTASGLQARKQNIAFKLTVISDNPALPIHSNAGISVRPEAAHAPPGHFDYIATIGGGLEHLDRGSAADRAYLSQAHHNHVPLIAIGTGSFILAEEGLLNESRASIHPYHYDCFVQRFPQVYAEQGLDFIDEGDVLTCPGGISTLTLATALIRAHAGEDIAAATSRRLSLPPHDAATPRPANIALIPDSRLRRAVMIIEQYLTHPLNAARLAQDVKLSERQLNRLFHAEFGKTAREFIRSARLRYACWLLKNSQQSVTDIARRMRFSDCAHFIRHFQTEYGCTPGVWRSLQN
ncbi:GlxA family transcriptional regulator [Enterobacter chuandaensis]|uniref:GlxA family transcriptional regulator n=1 Tax=Enterobacter chuandaensis TaxID=2497875 RepID=UPI003D6FAF77